MALIIYTKEKRAKKFFFETSLPQLFRFQSFCCCYSILSHSIPIDILGVTHRLKCECVFAASRWYRIFRSESVCGRLYMSVLNAHFVSMIVLQVLQPDSQLFGNDNEPTSTFIQLNSSLSRLNCLKDSVKYSFFVLLSNSLLLSISNFICGLCSSLSLSRAAYTEKEAQSSLFFIFIFTFMCRSFALILFAMFICDELLKMSFSLCESSIFGQ